MQSEQYVGIDDLHRRRSVIVRRDHEGNTLEVTQVMNEDALAFSRAIRAAGEHPEVVLEATYGWYWAADLWPSSARRCTWPIHSATTGDTAG